jgi:hypothetical protein
MVYKITKFFRPTWLKAWINELHRYQSIGQLLLKIGLKKENLPAFISILADESVCGIENQGDGKSLVDIRKRLDYLFVFYYKVPLQVNSF